MSRQIDLSAVLSDTKMQLLANLGMLLMAVGFASVFQSLRDPTTWSVTALVFPAYTVLGLLCIRYRARKYARIVQAWEAYESAAATCAQSFKERSFEALPPVRPSLVSDSHIEVTVPRPLEQDDAKYLMQDRVPEAVARLLSPCGEAKSYLGRCDAIACERGPVPAERLTKAWVIDREWGDGRWTTEWLYASLDGSRLRVLGGGRAFGPRKLRDKQLAHQHKVLFVVGLIFMALSLIFPLLGTLMWFGTWMLLLFALAVHDLASVAFPVYMKASLSSLNSHSVPNLAFKSVQPFEGDTSALKLRLLDAVSSLNTFGAPVLMR